MCGIVGVLGNIPKEDVVIKARDTLAHRGPNDAGLFYDAHQGITLGHRRLSIIDLSPAGHQPLWSFDRRYVVVFNGEIYNYIELKKELEADFNFQTKTDTEVIIAAYHVWGDRCLDHFNGMFSFALYDTKERVFFAARDRLGVKPFYYTEQEGTYFFSSEIKGLLAFGVAPKVNDSVMYEYLAYGFYDHRPETFFEGIVSLPPGHYIRAQDGNFSIHRWWHLPDKQPQEGYWRMSKEDACEQLRALMTDSIKLRFRSDVPVGVNISSGLDSTSLLFFAEQVTQGELALFSMCLPDATFDECQFIKPLLSSQQLHRWHTSTLAPEQVMSGAHSMLSIQDQPYGGIPTIAYALLNESARAAGVTVLLEGQGVDEVLAGYNSYRVEFLQDMVSQGNWKKIGEYLHFKKNGQQSYVRSLFEVWNFSRLNTDVRSQDLTLQLASGVLRPDFCSMFNNERQTVLDQPFASKLLNAQYRDLRYLKLPRVLRFNDHVSMFYGRELRLPYLDYRLVEFCFFMPPEYKMEFGRQKVLLRDAMRGRIPEPAVLKAKVAFGAVQTAWMRAYFKDEVMSILTSASFRERPYWNADSAIAKAEQFFAGQGDNSFFLWQWINIELWLRHFIDQKDDF